MFKNGKSKNVEAKISPSVVGADLRIVGALVTKGRVQIDGVVDGDIHCGELEIGANGAVNGDVSADIVRLEGRINGKVTANSVFLMRTAHMLGDVHHANLSIEAGAIVDGNYRQRDASDASIEARLGGAAARHDETHSDDRRAVSANTVLQGPRGPA